MTGSTILHYRIDSELGRGGMGVVYRARDTRLNRDVAIKFLPAPLAASGDDRRRLQIEAQAAAALMHPNIAAIFAIEEADDQLFIVMEYVEGRELGEIITESPDSSDQEISPASKVRAYGNTPTSLDIATITDYATQIASGLRAAHARGVVHRDIKSSNLMITGDGQVKIMDFGLAKIVHRPRPGPDSAPAPAEPQPPQQLTNPGTTLGTAAYVSPEQARGEEVDLRSDIWSFGVVLYQMLTGKLPFTGEYEHAVIYSIVNEGYEPPGALRPDVPTAVADVVQKCLQKEPNDRYQDFAQVAADLSSTGVAAETGGRSATISASEIGVRTSLHKKIWLLSTAVPLLVLLAWFLARPFFSTGPDLLPSSGDPSIAVMYFENRSNESNLEKIVVDLLTTNLARHEQMQVVSSQRLYDILKNMGKLDVPVIGQYDATEVAQRANVRTMLLGSIVQLGSSIRINTQLVDVSTGTIIGADQAAGEHVEDVFSMVDTLTLRVQRKLIGADKSASEALKVADVTTQSYEAYKLYQQAVEDERRWEFSSARAGFLKASEIDTTFAMAHLRAALATAGPSIGNPLFDITSVVALVDRAERFSRRVSARERLLIQGTIPVLRRDLTRADTAMREYVTQYPDDKEGQYYRLLVATDVKAGERAIELDPAHALTYNYLGYVYALQGQFGAAVSAIKKYVALQPDVWNVYDSAWEVYCAAGQLEAARETLREARRRWPSRSRWYILQAYTELFEGRSDEAREWLRQAGAIGERYREHEDLARLFLHEGRYRDAYAKFEDELAVRRRSADLMGMVRLNLDLAKVAAKMARFGDAETALTAASDAAEQLYSSQFNPVRTLAPFIRARMQIRRGAREDANRLGTRMRTRLSSHPKDELLANFPHLLDVELALTRGKTADARAALSRIAHPGFQLFNPVYRLLSAELLAREGKFQAAIEAYERLQNAVTTKNDYARGDNVIYFSERPKISFYLAKLHEEMKNTTRAREEYTRFLHYWQNADADLPELAEARARLAALKTGNKEGEQ